MNVVIYIFCINELYGDQTDECCVAQEIMDLYYMTDCIHSIWILAADTLMLTRQDIV